MDIEQVWKGHGPGTGDLPDINNISRLSAPEPDSILQKLKKALRFNLSCAWLCLVLYVFILVNYHLWQLLVLIGLTLVFTLWAIITTTQLYRSVNPNVLATSLLIELKRNRNALNRWMQLQMRVALAIYPFSVSGGFLWGGMMGSGKSIEFLMSKPIIIWALVVCIIILTPLSYWLAKWLFKKSFGKVTLQMNDAIAQLTADGQ